MTAGYSATPLAKKLSLKDGQRVWFHAIPESVLTEINQYSLNLTIGTTPEDGIDAAHVFVTERDQMADLLAILRNAIAVDGQVWVSWPKQASRVATDITEDSIREIALPLGFIDIKVCAVDTVWSGLKLVIRKELR